MTKNPKYLVVGQFTPEGVSVTVYGEKNQVIDETWFTWDEVDLQIEMNAEYGTSSFTFELD